MKDKVINDLLKRISDLEFEVERLEKREKECIDHYLVQCKYASEMEDKYITEKYKNNKAIEYIEQNEFYLDYKTGACIKGVMPLLDILKGVDK